MTDPRQAPATVNPHWWEFFRRIRRAAERLDALERKEKSKAGHGGPR